MAHCIVPEAEAILDTAFPVLDKGFVRLVDYLGSDDRIVQAARVSYAAGTKSYRKDKGLIQYLLRNDHTSPFEQVNFTFHIKMPIFVARQWIRHRTARLNEISGRYSVMTDECYLPEDTVISYQSDDNKQGRSTEPVPEELRRKVRQLLEDDQKRTYEVYSELLDMGLARELARINLPLSLYTEWYWQMDLHNLFHFLQLRMDPHAQYEIRVYASEIFRIIQHVCPIACEAFEELKLGGELFSRREIEQLERMTDESRCTLEGREREIFLAKLQKGGKPILSS
ncbi:MAG: FAD-dependent thymidylate synthase [Spirochaetia bacterium]|nr:FAD-dependent thymidylate synthase [Spirochaetia bacterium]